MTLVKQKTVKQQIDELNSLKQHLEAQLQLKLQQFKDGWGYFSSEAVKDTAQKAYDYIDDYDYYINTIKELDKLNKIYEDSNNKDNLYIIS